MGEAPLVRAIAVDDDPGDLRTLERLSKYGVECRAMAPPLAESFQDKIFKPIEDGDIDVVLLDFRLDADSEPGRLPAVYRGGMLAAAIKERFPGMPIVLITTENKHKEYVKDNPRIRDLFDHRLLKSAVFGKPSQRKAAALEIIDLAEGMKRIAVALRPKYKDAWGPQLRILGIDKPELEVLKARVGGAAHLESADVASWLLRELLAFPGPLLDRDEARARLGLTASAFKREGVQNWAGAAKYRGVFCRLRPRWWEGKLLDLLRATAGDAATRSAKERAVAIAGVCGERALPAARCPSCDSGLVQRACYVCREPVDATHHLTARVDSRPVWALRAVVCFRCIETGIDEACSSIQYGPGARGIVEELRTSSE